VDFYFILLGSLLSTNIWSAQIWSDAYDVSYVRTYDGDTYSIGLNGFRCPNDKDYFYVGDRVNNQSFHAIALASLTTGKKVKILYEPAQDTTHCYVKGIWIIK